MSFSIYSFLPAPLVSLSRSAFLLVTFTGISGSVLADEISLERLSGGSFVNASENLSDQSAKKSDPTKIDWSKPVVSRGFGLDASQGEANNDALMQYQSGQVFYFFGEYNKAVEKWIPLLDKNFPEAQASMGWLYQVGVGVEKNEAKAFQLYTQAAKNNNAIAQNNLGVMYENGITVEKNNKQAMQWYKRSAEQGYRFGQFNYANMLLLKTTQSSINEAKRLLQKSADQGVVQAKSKLETLS